MSYRPPMTREEQIERLKRFAKLFAQAGRESTDDQLDGYVEATQMIPVRQLWPAVLLARQRSTSGFLPEPGQVIAAARDVGRWHDPDSGAMRDPWWYRSWEKGRHVRPVPGEPHEPPGVARQIPSSTQDQTFDEMRVEAGRDIAAHEVHKRTRLVPSRCVRCVLDLHREHSEPVDNCLRCQIGAAA